MQQLRRELKKLTETKKAGLSQLCLNVANVGKFTSDRTIEEYVQDIWHLEKVKVKMDV